MYDLVVLGGGPGGLSVASAAARIGARVALIEKHHLGGECTYSACIPSKALIEAARLAHRIRKANRLGIRVAPPEIDFAAVMERVRSVVGHFAGSDSGDSLRASGIDVFRGSPAFEAYDTVLVDGTTRVNGQRFVIATGSRAAVPTVPGLSDAGYLDNVSVWKLNELPRTLTVIGAGPSGIEFAQAFSRLGSAVTVLADSPQILPREDPEVADRLEVSLSDEGITILKDVQVTRVAVRDGQKVCTYRAKLAAEDREVSGTHLLVATGRLANVEGLNLDEVGVHADPEHGIEVDDYLQTRSTRVYAIGDVLQRQMFTHAAEREAQVAYQNAVLRLPRKIDYSALPWATFTEPEVATVGLSEAAARQQSDDVRVLRADFADLDRAVVDGLTDGFAKVIATPSGKILGATIVGEQASLILQEFVLAMEHGLTLPDIASTVHPFPTYAGMAQKLANQFTASRGERGFLQTALKWFRGFTPRTEEAASPGEPEPQADEPAASGVSNGHGL
jgi:pyruvate/2-oxoglutarate dehydrogenase complex dihydrolipoamide dehydrogenase (E3) component